MRLKPVGRNLLKLLALPLVLSPGAGWADRVPDELPACVPVPECVPSPPPTGPIRKVRRHKRSALVMRMGPAQHRVLDRYLDPQEPQIIVGKFAYSGIDKDLEDEIVEVYARPSCQGEWVALGEVITSDDQANHRSVDRVSNQGGQVFFHIPETHRLPLGRHEVYLRVAADGTGARGILEVVAPGTPAVVVDLDGTLTPQVSSEVTAFLSGRDAEIRPGAAASLQTLAKKGFRFYYLSTRPDWLTERARAYLSNHGAPQGVVQLASNPLGELKIDAETYKRQRLETLRTHGVVAVAAFGDKPTDARAYAQAGVGPSRFILARPNSSGHPPEIIAEITATGGTPIAEWSDVQPWLATLPVARCPTPLPVGPVPDAGAPETKTP